MLRTVAGSLQWKHELTLRREFIVMLATGWHFGLLINKPTQWYLQHLDLLESLETWEWLTLRETGTVPPGADVVKKYYMQ